MILIIDNFNALKSYMYKQNTLIQAVTKKAKHQHNIHFLRHTPIAILKKRRHYQSQQINM